MSDKKLRELERDRKAWGTEDRQAEGRLRAERCRSGQCCAHESSELPEEDRYVWVPFRLSYDGQGPRYPCLSWANSSRNDARTDVERAIGETWRELRKKSNGSWRLYRCEVRILPLPGGRSPL